MYQEEIFYFLFESCWGGCAIQLFRDVGEIKILVEVWSVLQILKAPDLTNTFSPWGQGHTQLHPKAVLGWTQGINLSLSSLPFPAWFMKGLDPDMWDQRLA